jgi:MFS family permease
MLKLIKEHPKLVIYFFLCAFFTGFGQTFLLSLFNQDLMNKLGISNREISAVYSFATLTAAFCLPLLGKLSDRFALNRLIYPLSFILALSLGLLSLASNGWMLFLAYVSVRAIGQSGLSLTVMSQVTRTFGSFRGRILSLYSLGRSSAEAFLPFLILGLLVNAHFENKILVLAGMVAIILPLASFFLLPKDFGFKPLYSEKKEVAKLQSVQANMFQSWTDVYKDYRIYFIVLGDLVLPFVMTGFFFQNHIWLEWKGWSLIDWGQAMVLYAITQSLFNLLSGPLIDRLTAIKLLPLAYLPMIGACWSFWALSEKWALFLVMLLFGACLGAVANCRNAVTAELFGPKDLGVLKSITSTIVVASSALAPISMAWLIDRYSAEQAAVLLLVLASLTLPSYGIGFHLYRRSLKDVDIES